MVFSIPGVSNAQVWLDGSELQSLSKAGNNEMRFQLTAEKLQAEDTHLLVIKLPTQVALTGSPRVRRDGDDSWLELTGNWELRLGNDSELSKIPLPAKFGTGSDIYIEPKPLR